MGAAFRHVRMANGLTLNQAATAAGIDHTHLCRFERGQRRLRHDDLTALTAAIGLGDVQPATPTQGAVCQWCTGTMSAKRSTRRFCSDACRKAASRASRNAEDRTQAGVVYFLHRDGRVKIGTTVNLRARVQHFQQGLDDLLGIVPGGSLVELAWHQQWQALRDDTGMGREWFHLTDELRTAITGAVAAAGLDVHVVASVQHAERVAGKRKTSAVTHVRT